MAAIAVNFMAVPVGFEPTVGSHPHNFSRVAPSAARTPYRDRSYMTQPALQNPHRASTVHMSVPPSFPGSHREKHASTRAHVGGYPYRHTHDTHLTHLLLHRVWVECREVGGAL